MAEVDYGRVIETNFPYDARIVKVAENPKHTRDFSWGRLDYKLSPFDIFYTAYDKQGQVIESQALEFPIEDERDTEETVQVVGRRIENLVKDRK